VGTRLSDSEQYAHLWGTPELARVFAERARLQSWLDILTALAAAQARLGIIPAEAVASRSRVPPPTTSTSIPTNDPGR
jgi:adenylosuccinate lyase